MTVLTKRERRASRRAGIHQRARRRSVAAAPEKRESATLGEKVEPRGGRA